MPDPRGILSPAAIEDIARNAAAAVDAELQRAGYEPHYVLEVDEETGASWMEVEHDDPVVDVYHAVVRELTPHDVPKEES